jgi:cell division protein FtsI (penicillin-binding protein 3)
MTTSVRERRPPARRPQARRPPARRRPPTRRAGEATQVALSNALVRARSSRRLTAILACYLLLSGAMAYRLISVQVLDAEQYRELGEQQTQREVTLAARRGTLTDREGQPLAMSLTAATVYANPRQITAAGIDPATVAGPLATALGLDPAQVLADLTGDRTFVYVARQVPRGTGEQVAGLDLPGIGVLDEPTRTYPNAPLASSLVGGVDIDQLGTSGLEQQYDSVLTGTPGTLSLERAPGGLEISTAPREATPPVAGTDLALTIDREIQAAAEDAIARTVTAGQADGGAAIVMDAATGQILAMANAGPNGELGGHNRAATDVYEPGSVNKVITLSAALEEGLVTPTSEIVVPDAYTVAGKTFDDDGHGPEGDTATTAEIMIRSSNVGTIRIAELLGPERLHDYVARFGYGRAPGLDFPGETAGLLPDVASWSGTSLPTIAIGHGVSATLLQVAGVYQTIANGGEWVQPSLVMGATSAEGQFVPQTPPEHRRVVSEGTASAVAQMLGGVVENEHGTGHNAAVPGYRVGGKTGTARKPLDGGYEPGAYIGSFAGFGPVDDPRLVVAVMIDEPRAGSYFGGAVAAPVFAEIMGFALAHERVPPSPGAPEVPAEAVPIPPEEPPA